MDLAFSILLSGLALFLIGNTVLACARGSIRHGRVILLLTEEPVFFWIVVASGVAMACACVLPIWVFMTTGSLPRTPLIMLGFLLGMAAVWLRDLQRGVATIGAVTFARAEEPREFWLLLSLKIGFLLLACAPFVLGTFI